jgi:hypothetical protein
MLLTKPRRQYTAAATPPPPPAAPVSLAEYPLCQQRYLRFSRLLCALGTQFTGFTSTKVPILTPSVVYCVPSPPPSEANEGAKSARRKVLNVFFF